MLPSASPSARSIVGVADDLLAVLSGADNALGRAKSVVLVVIDGLGASALRAHAGHARQLSSAMGKKDVATSVFPSTTASALTTLLTGTWPGEHGLVGYRVRHPDRHNIFNQLSDWQDAGLDPLTWQGSKTVFERASEGGAATYAVGLSSFAGTGLTQAVLRGATFVGVDNTQDRVASAYELAARNPGALVYCYLPELDKAGHQHGLASLEWTAALEDVDAAMRQVVPAGVGVVVTSDHGMVDVPAHRHFTVEASDSCLNGVQLVGGEPRMLHVYLEEGVDAAASAARWEQTLGSAAQVSTNAVAIGAGLFGPQVTADAASRIGDLVVAARANWAIYVGDDQHGRGMIGQHGSVSPEEIQVPLIRLGSFS
jgi:hypothetical protein